MGCQTGVIKQLRIGPSQGLLLWISQDCFKMNHWKILALVFLLYLQNFVSTVKGKVVHYNLTHIMKWLGISIHVHSLFIEDIEALEASCETFSKRSLYFVNFILRNS